MKITPTVARNTLALANPVEPTSPRKPEEIDVIACPTGNFELRTIRGTLSPAKQYAIA